MRHLKSHLDPLAWHFAELMCELAHYPTKSLFLGALVASLVTEEQHACAYLPDYCGKPVVETHLDQPADKLLGLKPDHSVFYPADLEAWKRGLRKHADVVGQPGEYKPLILEGDRLYLYRYWDYEKRLATAIKQRFEPLEITPHTEDSHAFLNRLFPPEAEINWQAIAAVSALHHRFQVISGGPGTGKTTTVSRMVALLLHQTPDLRIVLAAPTGKAATRMKESLSQSRSQLNLPETLLSQFPQEALTLHRLLGYQVKTGTYRHHKDHPLPWDMVIVDEASMIDLAMMTRLFEALPDASRLVLLGDRHQLASVEAGSVLGDICKAAKVEAFSKKERDYLRERGVLTASQEAELLPSEHAMDDHVVILKKSHRFDADKGIGKLAQCVQSGEIKTLEACLQAQEIHHQTHWSPADLHSLLLAHYQPYFNAETPLEAWKALSAMMVLCAVKRGPRGVQAMNQQIEQVLSTQGHIHPGSTSGSFYHLRPVMITQNDYRNQLFNGDIGVTWQPKEQNNQSDQSNQKTEVYFQRSDGSFRSFHPAQIGPHSTTWAMTIHKSQGSEFNHVLLVLPEVPHPLVSRELIYTGITRARESVNLWCDLDILKAGVNHQVERYSGLIEALNSCDIV